MEIKRIVSYKILIFILLCLSANLLIHIRINRSSNEVNNKYISLVEQYRDVDINTALKLIKKGQNTEHDDIETTPLEEDNSDEDADSKLRDQLNYIKQYSDRIDQVLSNADHMLNVSTFNGTNTFSYHNIIKTRQDFSSLKEIQPVLINDVAAKDLIGYHITWYFVFATALLVIFEMLKDRDNGMICITFTSAGGRLYLSLKRIGILFLITFLSAILYHGSIFLFDVIQYSGIGDLHYCIQCIDTCSYVMAHLSIIRYLFIDFFAGWFMVTTATMFTYMLFLMIKSRKLALCFICIFIGIEYALYQKIDMHSALSILRTVNVMKVFQYGDILSQYKNYGIGSFIIQLKVLMIYGALLICIIAIMVSIYLSSKKYPTQSKKLKLTCVIEELIGKLTSKFPQGQLELYKIMVVSKGYIVTAIVMIICGLVLYNSTVTFSRQQQSLDAEYLKYGGTDYTYFKNYVDNVNEKIDDAKQKLNEAKNNQTDTSGPNTEYYMALSELQYENNYKMYIEEYEEKLDYLDRLKGEDGITGYIMSDRGYEEMIGSYSVNKNLIIMLVLSCGLVLLLSDSFIMEKTTNMVRIIRSAKKGRRQFCRRKIVVCLVSAAIIIMIVNGFQWMSLLYEYGLPYSNAPVQSLTFMEHCPVKVTIMQWIVSMVALKMIWYLCIAMITVSVSIIAINRNSRVVMVVVLLITSSADLIFLMIGFWGQVLLSVTGIIIGIACMFYACNKWECRRS